ncbi:sensor histidine kinase [Pararhodospirillum oryzae]|uniref:histidine kinase n=1 Tax=Pararhodospirillum oryzae TaxID=478448 RepID=A0A512HC88_9PROT|nr:ATP-binding protein [Pararhodospirillum oryzae]GEO83020.1 hypothetical protein ROR02_31510 [Pararhodospirillum oryzae]
MSTSPSGRVRLPPETDAAAYAAKLTRLDFALTIRKALIDALPVAVALLDGGGRLTACNATWTSSMGDHPPGTLYVEGCQEEGLFGPGDGVRVRRGLFEVIEGDREYFSLDILCGGKVKGRAYNVTVVPLDRAAFDGVVVLHTDITERQSLYHNLMEQTARLEKANEELRQFARIVSHDLKEPLRGVVSFVQLLARRNQGHLDAEAEQFMGYIVSSAKRMETQLNALISYIQTAQDAAPLHPVNLDALVRGVANDMTDGLRQQGGSITVDPLPAISGDEVLIASLFRNLLGNAVRYRQADRPLRVRVSARKAPGVWEIIVADNGIGIPAAYHESIFSMFTRLDPQNHPEGSGVGLAIARKVAERHGGRLWVESAPGEGSQFHFTVPDTGCRPPSPSQAAP